MKTEEFESILLEIERAIEQGREANQLADSVSTERSELIRQLEESRNEVDLLVDKVVDTENDRDDLKLELAKLAEHSTNLETRNGDLAQQVADLEREIEKRDRAVKAMAEKYQLVPKDTFGEEVIEEALSEEKKSS